MINAKRTLSLLLLPALLALGACSANPATGKQDFTAFMSPAEEIRVGAQEHPKILKQFGGAYKNRKVTEYVRELGLELAKTSELPDLPWTFTVLNETKVNAFALPGGYVYVTRGLLALASDEAELAGVLSHEIGHVTARHTAQRYSASVATNIGVEILGVLSQAAGMGGVRDIASVGANLALLSYSREQELESDMLGVRYMTRLGYDPAALISFFEKLSLHQALAAKMAGQEGSGEPNSLLSTHPRTADRIHQAIDLSDKNGQVESDAGVTTTPRRGAAEYLALIDGLTFGDGIDQGSIRGRVFIHSTENFRFEVPEGFVLANAPSQVTAEHKSGAYIVFAHAPVDKVREQGSLQRYLTNVWSSDVRLEDVEWLNVNGMSAVTGVARGISTRGGAVDVRRIVIEQTPDRIWRFQFATPSNQRGVFDEGLRRTTYSFRAPTSAERKSAQPNHLRVVSVGTGVTYEDLVASMAVEEFKAEWFTALNNILPGTELTPGQRVKVVK